MKAPTEAQLKRRREDVVIIRARGRRHFIVLRGILGFGLPWSIFMAAGAFFTSAYSYRAPYVSQALPRWLGWLLFVLPFGLLAGAGWGWYMWRMFERKNWFLPPATDDGSRPIL